jgi:hypothetical protein
VAKLSVQWMRLLQTQKLNRAALKSGMRKQKRAERTATQAGKPAPQRPAVRRRKHTMGEDHRASIALQQHLA